MMKVKTFLGETLGIDLRGKFIYNGIVMLDKKLAFLVKGEILEIGEIIISLNFL